MSKDTRNNIGTFTDAASSDVTEENERIGETFVPEEGQTPEGPPESIDSDLFNTNTQSFDQLASTSVALERKAKNGLKIVFIAVLIYVTILLGYNTHEVIDAALSVHWTLAALLGTMIIALLLIAGRIVWSWVNDRDTVTAVHRFQREATRFRAQRSHKHIEPYLEELSAFYAEKPQFDLFQQMRELLPDYADDKEALEHVENLFVRKLDQQAFACISHYSAQTGVAVALSPWASMDMLLTLWRNAKMIEQISKIYGIRPSYRNRLRILTQVMNNMAFAGVSEMAADFLTSAAESKLMAQVSARAGEGFGSAVISVRIGLTAVNQCRPIPFADDAPRLAQFIKPLIAQVTGVFRSEPELRKDSA